ncbi:unnamed protein product [Effrenium voratum]|uniref:Uncharacterized protein n=1 Tax=Effrenium voratum TaxID=2562239 RepID=A0AA36MYK8_9DINO|nr:unnamed protein product [Effrenium voratum]
MPRAVLDAADLVLDATLVQEVLAGTTADVAKFFGMSERAAGLYQAIHEEFTGTKGDEELCMLLCCCCAICSDEGCCKDSSSRRRRLGMLMQTEPGQLSMDETDVSSQPKVGRSESFLDMLKRGITKDDIVNFFRDEAWTKKETYLLWLVKMKFGNQDRDDMQSCLAQVKAKAPDALMEDHVNATRLEEHIKQARTDGKAVMGLAKTLAAAFLMKHGAQLQSGGLGGIGLGACSKIFCDGALQYEVTESGMHQCRWTCPAGQIPHTYKELRLSQEGVVEPDPISIPGSEQVAESAVADASSDPANFGKSRTWSLLNGIPYNAEPAYSSEPLKILKTFSATRLGSSMPAALRYWGGCRPLAPQVGDILVFNLASHPQIPKGSLVKVTYLEDAQVKYNDEVYEVLLTSLQHKDLVPLQMPSGLKDWLLATNETLAVNLPQPTLAGEADTYFVTPEESKKGR